MGGGGMEKYGAGSIVVSDYDPNWPTLFEQEPVGRVPFNPPSRVQRRVKENPPYGCYLS